MCRDEPNRLGNLKASATRSGMGSEAHIERATQQRASLACCPSGFGEDSVRCSCMQAYGGCRSDSNDNGVRVDRECFAPTQAKSVGQAESIVFGNDIIPHRQVWGWGRRRGAVEGRGWELHQCRRRKLWPWRVVHCMLHQAPQVPAGVVSGLHM